MVQCALQEFKSVWKELNNHTVKEHYMSLQYDTYIN